MRKQPPQAKFKKGDNVRTPYGNMQVVYYLSVETVKGVHIEYRCVPLTKKGTVFKNKIRQADWNPRCRFTENQIQLLTL